MSVTELRTLDMSAVLLQAYELGDLINSSREAADYLYWKEQMEQSEEVQEWVRKLQKKKELFEECQRFGHFHPDYHAAMNEVSRVQEEMDAIPAVRKFKEAEERLDGLLHEVSLTVARSVSESIKVPSNNPEPEGGGCSSGGGCSGKCG